MNIKIELCLDGYEGGYHRPSKSCDKTNTGVIRADEAVVEFSNKQKSVRPCKIGPQLMILTSLTPASPLGLEIRHLPLNICWSTPNNLFLLFIFYVCMFKKLLCYINIY